MGNSGQEPGRLPMTGIILAGGKSSRMGRNKALLEWQGQSLLDRSLQVLRSLFSEVLISANSPELYQNYPERVISDHYRNCGPLGGLQACLEAAQHEYAFFVACDMPFIDQAVIRFLAGLTGEAAVVVPEDGQGLHPLHAFYAKSCLPIITKQLENHDFSIVSFYPQCAVRVVKWDELSLFPQRERIFRNINTPQEWEEIQSSL